MKRRSRGGSKPAKARAHKAVKRKGRAPKALSKRTSSPARQETQVARLTRELNEALERQRATAEVLSAISRSNFELQPILQSVVDSASQLCRADASVIFRLQGGVYRFAAGYSLSPAYLGHERRTPISPGPGTVIGRAAMRRQVVRIEDAWTDPLYEQKAAVKMEGGGRSMIGVPLMREGEPIGVIGLARNRVDPFTEREIELVTTFAAQAVIAIENTRLLSELRESLEEQTATANVLKVISRSAFDLQTVLQTLVESASRLCDADRGTITRQKDGVFYRASATYGHSREFVDHFKDVPISQADRGSATGRALFEGKVIHIPDVKADPEYTLLEAQRLGDYRTVLAVPMLREGVSIGALTLSRSDVRPFTAKQIELVTTFADQAAIAIENARLLGELRERTIQLQEQSQQVVKLNQRLEQRVADQVGEIERMSRLRRFLPPQVADLIVASGAEKQLESHRREITALFCDLRGFTGFSESADPEDVMALLREYHAAIGEIIIKYSGTLERYAGDGVMVVFNDPVPVPEPALQAVRAALDMRSAIGALTEKWSRLGHDLGFGVGIAHGHATLGTIGFEGRFDYSAIGTVSNVASRLCDEAKPGQILISPRVLMAVEDAVTVEPVGEFELKGIRRPVAAYNVVAALPTSP